MRTKFRIRIKTVVLLKQGMGMGQIIAVLLLSTQLSMIWTQFTLPTATHTLILMFVI